MARKGVPLSDAHKAALKEAAARRRAVPEVTGSAASRSPLTNAPDWPVDRPEPPYRDKGDGRRVYKLPPGDVYLECFATTKIAVLSRVGAGAVMRLGEAQQDALLAALGHWRA